MMKKKVSFCIIKLAWDSFHECLNIFSVLIFLVALFLQSKPYVR